MNILPDFLIDFKKKDSKNKEVEHLSIEIEYFPRENKEKDKKDSKVITIEIL